MFLVKIFIGYLPRKVLDVRRDEITIQDIKNESVVDEKVVGGHFGYAYCATCHYRRGTPIDGNIKNSRMEQRIFGE